MSTRIPRDPDERARLYDEAQLTKAERVALEAILPHDFNDLLTAEQRESLNADLAEMARLRRRAQVESAGIEMP